MQSDSKDQPEREILTVWEGGMLLNVRDENGKPITARLNWLEFEEIMQMIVYAVDAIPDEDLKARLLRIWGKKFNGHDIRNEVDRLEDQRNTRRF